MHKTGPTPTAAHMGRPSAAPASLRARRRTRSGKPSSSQGTGAWPGARSSQKRHCRTGTMRSLLPGVPPALPSGTGVRHS